MVLGAVGGALAKKGFKAVKKMASKSSLGKKVLSKLGAKVRRKNKRSFRSKMKSAYQAAALAKIKGRALKAQLSSYKV